MTSYYMPERQHSMTLEKYSSFSTQYSKPVTRQRKQASPMSAVLKLFPLPEQDVVLSVTPKSCQIHSAGGLPVHQWLPVPSSANKSDFSAPSLTCAAFDISTTGALFLGSSGEEAYAYDVMTDCSRPVLTFQVGGPSMCLASGSR